jgi:hypothetical protein
MSGQKVLATVVDASAELQRHLQQQSERAPDLS